MRPPPQPWLDSVLDPAVAAPTRPRWPAGRTAAITALLYAVLALLSLYVSRQPGSIATIWYANAVAVAVLLMAPAGARLVTWLAVAGGNLAANLIWHPDLRLSLSFLPANLCEIAIAVWLLRRAGLDRTDLRSPAALLQLLLLGGVIPQLFGASLGAATLRQVSGSPFGEAWLMWLEGSVIGAVSILPLAVLCLAQPKVVSRQHLLDWRLAALLPAAVGLTILVLAHLPFPFIYLSLPLLLAAMTVELVAVYAATAVVSVTVAMVLALGIFVPPPVQASWQQAYLYLPFAAALLPAQLLAATVAAMRDGQDRLQAQTRALQHANTRLEQFVRIASHDLREPLNTVAQFGGLIEQDHGAALPPDGREYLRLIRQATARMRRLLDDVLHYAKLQEGVAGPREPVDLNLVFGELRESLASRIEATGATLEIGPLPTVPGHAALLSLLFQNLLANAMKFVPPGRTPQVRVHGSLGPRAVVITVLDNGIGIAPADLPKLFKPFQRLHLQRHYEGTGLGLALCRQVVDAHGGRIQVESVPGEGSRFHVRLPLR